VQPISSSAAVSYAPDCYVGVDVAKDRLDLARLDPSAGQPSNQRLSFSNDPAGIQQVLQLMRQWNPARIAIESTGKLERPLLIALIDAGLNACHVNPVRVRRFAQGMGLLAKTDTLDALVLAHFACKAGPRIASKTPQNRVELTELVTCRRQLIQARTAHSNQRSRTDSAFAARQLASVLEHLEQRIGELEERIAALIDDDDDMRHLDQLLRSVSGVGAVLSATLLALLPELGRIDHGPLAALVGLAPFNDDSGRHKGQRHIRGGRGAVRNVLYVCTVCAIRTNAAIKSKYKDLLARGKAKKQAIIACARKLLRILNALARDGVHYQDRSLNNLTPET
jgi:transposase